jgi:hypothetical protein
MSTHVAEPVPEIGPLLGRLASPAPRGPGAFPLDAVRLDLAGALFARAGVARREMDAGRVDLARHQLSREAWLAAWRDAVSVVTRGCVEELDRRFRAAAEESRMPAKVLARRIPNEEDRLVITSRLESAGIPLETAAPPEDAGPWGDGLLRVAMAADESWERLERMVVAELASWQPDVDAVRAWIRPRSLLWAISALGFAGALGLGLMLGGYLPAPGPLGALQHWFWNLPWP